MDLTTPLTFQPPIEDPIVERLRQDRSGLEPRPDPEHDFRGVLLDALDLSRESPEVRQARRNRALHDLPVSRSPGEDPAAHERYKLRQAAAQFESVFVTMLMKQMRATIQKSEMFHGGRGEEIFQGMMDQQIAKDASSGNGLGIGRMIYEDLVKHLAFSKESLKSSALTADEGG